MRFKNAVDLGRGKGLRGLSVIALLLLVAGAWPSIADEPKPAAPAPVIAEVAPIAGNGSAVSPAPADPAAATVYGVLDTHCASCHQQGRGGAARAATPAVNFLDLEALAKDRSLVAPGFPDASGLYLELLRRHRPADFFRDGARWTGPSAVDIDAVRTWIEALPVDTSGTAEPITAVASAGPAIRINLRADRKAYKAGELLTLSIQSDTDCHLTLVSIDGSGRAIVLFPNDLEPDNKLVAGGMRRIPGDGAAYQLRLDTRGQEIISATCTTAARPPLGIEHEFGRRRFTILGDWRKFLTAALEKEALGEPRRPERRRARRRGEPRKPPADAALGPGVLPLEARTAIVVKVE